MVYNWPPSILTELSRVAMNHSERFIGESRMKKTQHAHLADIKYYCEAMNLRFKLAANEIYIELATFTATDGV